MLRISRSFLRREGYKHTPLYDVMSAYPYSALSAHKIKQTMALALGGNQPRYFYQTGQKARLSEVDMDDIVGKSVLQIDKAIAELRALAVNIGAPETTFEPILFDKKKRVELIE